MGTPSFQYLIIGSGRVANHFKYYFTLKQIPFLSWSRKENSESELLPLLEQVATALVLISDSAIKDFYQQKLNVFRGSVVHFSGALEIAGTDGFHPLMTFGPELYKPEFYESIFFSSSSEEKFRVCFPKLSNPVFVLNPAHKALYHALCVMSGNFSQILWRQGLLNLESLGVPPQAFHLYLHRGLENFIAHPQRSLTGPLARKDWQTMQGNVEALPENLQQLYLAFVKFYLPQSNIGNSARSTDASDLGV
jgi:predicted short-subunit dehydrogenase-like oxidoreductase (DUF2520 family)